jgi:hypothetical protein
MIEIEQLSDKNILQTEKIERRKITTQVEEPQRHIYPTSTTSVNKLTAIDNSTCKDRNFNKKDNSTKHDENPIPRTKEHNEQHLLREQGKELRTDCSAGRKDSDNKNSPQLKDSTKENKRQTKTTSITYQRQEERKSHIIQFTGINVMGLQDREATSRDLNLSAIRKLLYSTNPELEKEVKIAIREDGTNTVRVLVLGRGLTGGATLNRERREEFSIGTLNLGGGLVNKIDPVLDICIEQDLDCLCLEETGIGARVRRTCRKKGYEIIQSEGKHMGVAILIRRKLYKRIVE